MNRLLLASTFLFATGSAALAADAVTYEVAPEAPLVAAFNWTGAYVGVHLGYGRADATVIDLDDYSFSSFGDTEFDFDADGFLGGVHAGYNWQAGSLVYGFEADVTASDINNTVANSMIPGSDESFSTSIDWFGTARARLGYAAGRFLPYVTGGVAFGDIESSYDDDDVGQDHHAVASDVVWGWTAGAGIEYAVTDAWSLRTEYLFVDLEDNRGSFETAIDGTFRFDFDNDIHVLRIGSSYKF